MRHFLPHAAALVRLCRWLLIVSLLPLQMVAQAQSSDETWFLSTNMLTLDPSNRFVGSVIATNHSRDPIYVRTTVSRLELRDGQRVRLPDSTGALLAYPTEFVIQPGSSFTVRILSEPGRLPADAQSYYVRLSDVSNIALADEKAASGGLRGSYLLAFDTLVAVNRQPSIALTAGQFRLETRPDRTLWLTNLSTHHVYLDQGSSCASPQTYLVDCRAIPGFPRQSMLPGESIPVPDFATPHLGLMATAGLDQRRSRQSVLYLPHP